MSDKELAKRIIVEIVCQFGEVPTKSHLYKAFYFAHLYYAKDAIDYLSDWPIVKMPFGPGINDGDSLIHDLEKEGFIETNHTYTGPFPTTEFKATAKSLSELSDSAKNAIQRAVSFTQSKTAAELTEITHEYSHSWNQAENEGEELAIYIDLLGDDYEQRKQKVEKLAALVKTHWE